MLNLGWNILSAFLDFKVTFLLLKRTFLKMSNIMLKTAIWLCACFFIKMAFFPSEILKFGLLNTGIDYDNIYKERMIILLFTTNSCTAKSLDITRLSSYHCRNEKLVSLKAWFVNKIYFWPLHCFIYKNGEKKPQKRKKRNRMHFYFTSTGKWGLI